MCGCLLPVDWNRVWSVDHISTRDFFIFSSTRGRRRTLSSSPFFHSMSTFPTNDFLVLSDCNVDRGAGEGGGFLHNTHPRVAQWISGPWWNQTSERCPGAPPPSPTERSGPWWLIATPSPPPLVRGAWWYHQTVTLGIFENQLSWLMIEIRRGGRYKSYPQYTKC